MDVAVQLLPLLLRDIEPLLGTPPEHIFRAQCPLVGNQVVHFTLVQGGGVGVAKILCAGTAFEDVVAVGAIAAHKPADNGAVQPGVVQLQLFCELLLAGKVGPR